MWNMFSRLFRNSKTLRQHAPHLHAIAQHHSFAPVPTVLGAPLYEQSPYVYVAVNRIAEACALVPLHVYRRSAQGRERLEQHPLLALLDDPNPTTSRFELFEQTIGFLELAGNAYWFISGDEDGQPREIWCLRPDRVTIVPDSQQVVRGYLYELDGVRVPLEPLEVVHFKRWHPSNDYYGLSAVAVARLAATSDRAMAQWNANTFGRDHAIPAGILNVKGNVSRDDFERIKQEWRASYGTGQRRTAFLQGDAMEWIHVGLSHADLDFLGGRKAQRDEILSIFGVPIGLIDANATEANATVAERHFVERTLYPKLVRVAQRLTQELAPFYGADIVAEFEDIRPTDSNTRLREIATARGILTRDELRARFYNLPPTREEHADDSATRGLRPL